MSKIITSKSCVHLVELQILAMVAGFPQSKTVCTSLKDGEEERCVPKPKAFQAKEDGRGVRKNLLSKPAKWQQQRIGTRQQPPRQAGTWQPPPRQAGPWRQQWQPGPRQQPMTPLPPTTPREPHLPPAAGKIAQSSETLKMLVVGLASCILSMTSCLIFVKAIAMAVNPYLDSRGAWFVVPIIMCLSIIVILVGVCIDNKMVLYAGAAITMIIFLINLVTSIMILVYINEENRKGLDIFMNCKERVKGFYGDKCDFIFENKNKSKLFAEHIYSIALLICYCCPLVLGTVQYARSLRIYIIKP